MRADLIDRQAAIDIASGFCHPANIAKEIAELPSAQPEIIRCKDCKHYQEDHLFRIGFCDGRQRNNDDFCSRAERREDG